MMLKNVMKKLGKDCHAAFWISNPVNSGQSYKASTIVMYDSRVIPDLKIPHVTTLES